LSQLSIASVGCMQLKFKTLAEGELDVYETFLACIHYSLTIS